MALNPITYLKESKAELEKVTWPTRSQTIRLTLVVTAAAIIIGVYIGSLDTIFAILTERFLR